MFDISHRFDFDGEGSEDLSFKEGDVITLLERIGDQWARGEVDERTGIFPLDFVEVITIFKLCRA